MASSTAPTGNTDPLRERIRDSLSPEDLQKVDADPELRRIKDEAVIRENVAQEMTKSIRDDYTIAEQKLKSAEEVAEAACAEKWEAFQQAQNVLAYKREQYRDFVWQFQELKTDCDEWTIQYEAIPRELYGSAQQALDQARQVREHTSRAMEGCRWAQEQYVQACADARACRAEMDARKSLGGLAIDAVRADQFRSSATALERIQELLDAQSEVIDRDVPAAYH